MTQDDIITRTIITDPTIDNLIFQTISKYASRSSMVLPAALKASRIDLNSDNYGYIPAKGEKINRSMMGTAFDYLTRIVVCHDLNAFDFLLEQFQLTQPDFFRKNGKNLKALITECKLIFKDINIEELDKAKLEVVLYLSQYEQCFRSGYFKYGEKFAITDITVDHFKQMLYRSKNFFEQFGYPKIIDYHAALGDLPTEQPSLEYYVGRKITDLKTRLIGDGDYLLSNALVDFKVSTKDIEQVMWKKQLIIYYLGLFQEELAAHDVNKNDIHYLLNFNPRYNVVYKLEIDPFDKKLWGNLNFQIYQDILLDSEKAQRIAQKMVEDSKVRTITTEKQAKYIKNPFNKYKDGIHPISRLEYYRFYHNVVKKPQMSCEWPGQLWMVKRDGFYLFLLKDNRNSEYKILNGGAPKVTNYDLQYFYDNLPEYGSILIKAFSSYQKYLNELSREVKRFGGDGKNHGSIVDVDFFNHVYLDPMTGLMKFYSAESTSERRIIYPTMLKLLQAGDLLSPDPKLAENYKKKISNERLLESGKSYYNELMLPEDSEDLLKATDIGKGKIGKREDSYREDSYDKTMYSRSRAMNAIQKTLRYHVVVFWNDIVLSHQNKQISAQSIELIHQAQEKEQLETHRLIKVEESKKAVSNLIKDFDNPTYSSKKIKRFKTIKIDKPNKRVSLRDVDLTIIRKLIVASFVSNVENLDWYQIAAENNLKIRVDSKLINFLNKLRERINCLFEKVGKPEQIICYAKNNNDEYIGYADFRLKDSVIILDLVNNDKLNKKMIESVKEIAKQDNLKAGIYKVWQGELVLL